MNFIVSYSYKLHALTRPRTQALFYKEKYELIQYIYRPLCARLSCNWSVYIYWIVQIFLYKKEPGYEAGINIISHSGHGFQDDKYAR